MNTSSMTLSFPDPFVIIALAIICVSFLGGIRRAFFHPLRSFPGPKLAAITGWYRTYYDLVKDGGFLEHLEELHGRYGAVVRISPGELHFSDPDTYNAIYTRNTGNNFHKDRTFYKIFDQGGSLFTSTEFQEVKARKDIVGPPFSRRAISKLENVIQEKIDKLIARLSTYQTLNKSANIYLALRSTTMDIIISYCFAHNAGILDTPYFQHPLLKGVGVMTPMFWVFKHFPVIQWLLFSMPKQIVSAAAPEARGMMDCRSWLDERTTELLENPKLLQQVEHDTIFHHLMTEKARRIMNKDSLLGESLILLTAGSDTVGNTSWVGAFYILSNKDVLAKLLQELDDAWPDKEAAVGFEVLEKLPYLTAVIKESLRLAHGVVTPLPRVVGPSDVVLGGYHVPAGTVVSIGATFVHHNEDIFPENDKFIPERWLQPNARELENYLVPFSKGPRTCIGINLAWCELYLIFGNLFRKLDLKLHNASIDDLKFREYFIPFSRLKEMNVWVSERAS